MREKTKSQVYKSFNYGSHPRLGGSYLTRIKDIVMDRDSEILVIARKYLGLKSLRMKGSDSIDIKPIPVWDLKDAFVAAYNAGKASRSD